VGGSWKMLSLLISNDTQNENTYIELAAEFEIAKDLMLGIHFGDYSFDVSAGDYVDYNISLSKDDWSFMLSDTDNDGDDFRAVVSYSRSVDLL